MQFRVLPALTLVLGGVAQPVLAAPPSVVTDIPPVHALAAMVMGDLGSPALLLERGANAHHYQMRPADAQTLQEAGLVFWIGPGMTPWLERALQGIAPDTPAIALLTADGTVERQNAGDGEEGHEDHDHDDHDDHDHDHDHDHDGHDHGDVDPHAWLDPANARTWLAVIAGALSQADPENAETYAANAAAADQRIAALDTELAALLAPVADRPFVVAHDAYGYFADHYGLRVTGAVALGDATAPDAHHLSELRDTIAQSGAVCIFPEAGHDPRLITVLTEGTGLRVGAPLDPSGSSLDPGAGHYEVLMRTLGENLHACLAQG